jgi:sigma-B regulation protein RsbU (phosphoserine phosphatase)
MLADIDLATGKTVIGQAGHPHPVIQRKSGEIIQEGTGGFPVGLMSGVTFSQFETELAPGDRLLILSDGVTECPDTSGDMLGEPGLEAMIEALADVTGPALLEAVVWKLAEFAGYEDFPDDVSGIFFEFRGADQKK